VIAGAGFAGIGMAITLERAGIGDFVVLERASGVGGVWRDNSYPGCQCDVPSHLYSFSFAPKPDWSRSYGLRDEIRDYLEACTDRFGIRRFIRFGTAVVSALWDDDARLWRIETTGGSLTADVFVAGVGALSEPSWAGIQGIESFEGDVFHSAGWRHDLDLRGRRVAVVGTGASAIQFVPAIQPLVERLVVFQRTPPWIVPRMDAAIGPSLQARYRRYPWMQRAVRLWQYWSREAMVYGFTRRAPIQRYVRHVALKHLERQVEDPELRARLTPSYEIGCKRILLSDEWYPAIQQPNVRIVDSGVSEVRPRSVVAATGEEVDADTIIFGTGFNVTAHPGFDRIVGRSGASLGEQWRQHGMEAYAGTTVAGFPNLFLVVGPNTGLGHSSMVFMMEAQFAYVLGAIRTMNERGYSAVEPKPGAQAEFNSAIQARLKRSVWNSGGCRSWYLDERGCNPTLWPGPTWEFRMRLRRFDVESYDHVDRASVARESVAGEAAGVTE